MAYNPYRMNYTNAWTQPWRSFATLDDRDPVPPGREKYPQEVPLPEWPPPAIPTSPDGRESRNKYPQEVPPPQWPSPAIPTTPTPTTPTTTTPTTPATTTTTTPPATTTTPAAETYATLPQQYLTGLTAFIGDPKTFYATRGAEKQAQTDYYNFLNAWANRAGVSLTPDDWSRVWGSLQAYRTGYGAPNPARVWTVSDANNYMNRLLTTTPTLPQISYLRTGEI